MNLFLDTNILIDLVADRQPFSKWAYEIFKDQKKGRFTLYTSSMSILTTYFIIEKNLGYVKAKQTIKIILSRLEILPTEKLDLQTALTTRFTDYEDAVQHECAKSSVKIDYIITRNLKDFKSSIIEVLSSEELFFKL